MVGHCLVQAKPRGQAKGCREIDAHRAFNILAHIMSPNSSKIFCRSVRLQTEWWVQGSQPGAIVCRRVPLLRLIAERG
ncbi:hypothetical protein Tasa_052_015 [Tanticharoenia sakaeratensis NBRC 103193]|uniref:Uncharacterized protein n=1 Tax=Tanticharoenia sakaeratensis NBRC 103193 TaxID=1231623 RepID=A0A0D6MPM2_9PROT|nr:hypothetical protein Tasa_052_015 [Tanticharoenia sakaeratensis NBRC 103193]GBQ16519.1 hypothetical protein AA103193_0015 [Tanticharoenia sakaeratensis NBRC 103193]